MAFSSAEALALLRDCKTQKRLAHAYLVSGPEGSGTRELAASLAGLILDCPAPPFSHPDCHCIEPESKSRRIRIDVVRDLESKLHLRSLSGGSKVGILFEADRLMEQAANALLKTLEEPPSNSHLVLVTRFPENLLATILSRCIEVPLRLLQRPPLLPIEQKWLAQLARIADMTRTDLSLVYLLVRRFQEILGEARESIQQENETALKREEAVFKQTGNRDAFEEREEYYKALTESRCLHERSRLLLATEKWWGDALKTRAGTPADALDLPEFSEKTAALGSRFSTPELLSKSSAVSEMQARLQANVTEALALETGFLAVFG
jgi:DNA polymerase-3 subunit delta'